ncbi:STAS domain-containing protein [Amycolatopsis vancoresmycina]|uniref:Anti-anti-sigma factor n=1 Tax=Amycolatopsis vancoresmycina DSM 44592 TaxID=1292037 RepID=R1HTA1_9PSEU|nr:STAS domain-containing protein [Amycolatopsis vancoresmycina]EOD63531.1 anti-anti-sigma factor [Amycolatopsis vancoresmycina DSM 44592]
MDGQSESPVEVAASRVGEAMVVRLTGQVDACSSVTVTELMRASAAEPPVPPVVVVDLSGLGMLGAAGARALAQVMVTCAGRGSAVRVVAGPGGMVRRVLDIAGFGTVAAVFDDLEQALRAG